ncbi:MAG TPA: hypothetical protein VE524_07080, partial [Nitrososphaeraceae archaeon]|nr:hypothetical protein [Nitrososphaeraceae archaeon]
NHGEQLSNSIKIQKLGIGITLNPKIIEPSIIKKSIEKISTDNKYRKRASQLMEISNNLDGIENIKNIALSQI